jgi:antitoxin HicB
LPGCITYGGDLDEAIEMAKEAIELYIEELKERGETIPGF